MSQVMPGHTAEELEQLHPEQIQEQIQPPTKGFRTYKYKITRFCKSENAYKQYEITTQRPIRDGKRGRKVANSTKLKQMADLLGEEKVLVVLDHISRLQQYWDLHPSSAELVQDLAFIDTARDQIKAKLRELDERAAN